MNTENLLTALFDCHRFARSPDLQSIIDEVEARYGVEEMSEDELERIAAALNRMDRPEKDVIILRYYKGVTLAEISRMTGISYGVVKLTHKRALKMLRQSLEEVVVTS